MSDVWIRANSYCPVCRGVGGLDHCHPAPEFHSGSLYLNDLLMEKDRTSKLEAENAALKEQLSKLEAEIEQCCTGESLAFAEMRKQLAAAQKDAERYRWLKANCIKENPASRDGPSYKELSFVGEMYSDWKFAIDHVGLDAAIDAAAEKEAKP